jgi:nitrogenase-associated protein
MASVIFWRKLGCAGNARQIALLQASGHALELRDLAAEPWTPNSLRPFFGRLPVAAWFNKSAPRIKRGELRPETLTEAAAMQLLIDEPLLIRRPLLQCKGVRTAGFDRAFIARWIGLASDPTSIGEGCPRSDMAPCAPPSNVTTEATQFERPARQKDRF